MHLNESSPPAINNLYGPWWQLNPWPLVDDPELQAIAAYLDQAETEQILARCEQHRQYPQAVRRQLHQLGLSSFFTDRSKATMPHLSAVTMLCTRASASLGIDVGVNGLGLMPIYLGADDEQFDWAGQQLNQGAFCSILLTEIEHGSNLLANKTHAEAGALTAEGQFAPLTTSDDTKQPTHYRITGRKDLINGGSQHELFILFARTGGNKRDKGSSLANNREGRSRQGDFTLFLLDRRDFRAAITAPRRWHTLPTPAADIASVQFKQVIVPVANRIQAEGSGFRLVQKTLAITRGGVSVCAAGLANRAVQLIDHYARTRSIYGEPILKLGAIAGHHLRCQGLELLVAAMSLKATALLNRYGAGAVHYAAVAKYACCTLTEVLVNEGRQLHGAAALLLDRPYQRLVGDVLLFGVFDGTTHVTLDQIQGRLLQIAAQTTPDQALIVSQMRELYQTPPQPTRDVVRQRSRIILFDPTRYLGELSTEVSWGTLEPCLAVSHCLLRLVRRCQDEDLWEGDQGLRFKLAELYTWLETLIALVELADPGARQALGLPTGPLAQIDRALYTFTVGWFGGRLVSELQTTISRYGGTQSTALNDAALVFGQWFGQGRKQLMAELG